MFNTVFRGLRRGRRQGASGAGRGRSRPRLEVLETRTLLSFAAPVLLLVGILVATW